jgi:hypothetical protein
MFYSSVLEASLTTIETNSSSFKPAQTKISTQSINEITRVRQSRANEGGPEGSQSHQVSAMAANLATSAGFREDTVVPPPDRGGPLGGRRRRGRDQRGGGPAAPLGEEGAGRRVVRVWDF